MNTVRASQLDDVLMPETRLLLSVLNRAQLDARRGSVEATAWLLAYGLDLADSVSDGGSNAVLRFVQSVWDDVEAGRIRARYPDPRTLEVNYG